MKDCDGDRVSTDPGYRPIETGLTRILPWSWVGFVLLSCESVSAQILPDRTLPNPSIVTVEDAIQRITGGTQAERNLFHSFEQFNLQLGETAHFDHPLTVENIITRVTGGQVSNLEGLIQANGAANLFLLNPNGIFFGENAQLDIGGSFVASTADGLLFEDGSIYSATQPNTDALPLLSVNVPIGLQMGPNPGAITHRSQADSLLPLPNPDGVGLEVPPGQTLALVGGDLRVEGGNLRAIQGSIELGSVAQSGLVPLTLSTTGLALDYNGIEQFGTIEISEEAIINTSGLGAGAIGLRGGQVTLTDGSRLVADTFGELDGRGIEIEATGFRLDNGAWISSSTFGVGAAGNLTIAADLLEMVGTAPLEVSGQLAAGTFNPLNLSSGLFGFSASSGAAAKITLEAHRLQVRNGTTVMTSTFFDGAGGDITLNVSESAILRDGSLFVTGTTGSGDGGDIMAIAPQLQVIDGTSISTTPSFMSTGRAGNLMIQGESIELRGTPAGAPVPTGLFTTTLGAGDAGDIRVEAGQLVVADGAQISAAAAGSGGGGNLAIVAESVELRGLSPDGRFLGGLFTKNLGLKPRVFSAALILSCYNLIISGL